MSAAADFPEWRELREEAARQGDENYADFVAAYSLDYYRRRLRALGMTGHGDVLDVGAGFGQWSAALAAENGNVVSLEIHANRLGLSRGLTRRLGFPRVRQVRASASALPFADASFDLVVLMHALTYAERPAQAVAEAVRVLRKGGRLLLSSLARHEHRGVVEAYGHRNLGFGEKDLRKFAEKAGLKIGSCDTVTREKRPPHFEVISLIGVKP